MAAVVEETAPVEAQRRGRAVARAVLWVVLVASVLAAVWGTPRPASQDDFARALKAGEVRAIQTTDGRYGLEWTSVGVQVRIGPSYDQPLVLWEDARGMLHRTNLSPLAGGTPGGSGDRVDVLATIGATAQKAGVAAPSVDQGLGLATYAALPLGLVTLGFLGLLIFGRQPRRVTKWGMFWVIGIPLGIGLGWWLARDVPFSPAMAATAEPRPREKGMLRNGIRRTGGGVTFLVAWGVAILVGITSAIVIGLLGSSDESSGPVEPWTLVVAPQQSPFGP